MWGTVFTSRLVSPRHSPVGDAKGAGIRPGDQLLEVNGFSVRGAGHKEAGKLISEGSDSVTVLIHSVKPAPTPDGE